LSKNYFFTFFGIFSNQKFLEGESQTMAQVYSILTTLGIAIVSGSVTGMILRIPMIEHLTSFEYFEDGKYWEIEEEEED